MRDPIIFRERLIRLLDTCGARVIVLHAPAGYGKTTLARQWLAAGNRPHVWYTASPASSDIAVLCRDLVTAVRALVPGAGMQALNVLDGTSSPNDAATALGSALAPDLGSWPENHWLVIDDYHALAESRPAQTFVSALLRSAPVRLLITTRLHPSWMTARQRLYREIFEVSAEPLAMTDAEASEILKALPNQRVAEQLRKLANGWPVLVGLASFGATRKPPPGHVETTLFDYVAQELYDDLPTSLKWDVARLAIPPSISQETLSFLFGRRGDTVISAATERGFLSSSRPFAMHPLLRRFLNERLASDRGILDDAAKLARYLSSRGDQDSAFAIATTFRLASVLSDLIQESFRSLFDSNRLETAVRWIRSGREMGVSETLLKLIEAELAFRAGTFAHAEQLAATVVRATEDDPSLHGRALLVSARARFFRTDENGALAMLSRATDPGIPPEDRRELTWLRLLLSNELEMTDTPELLAEFERHVGSDLSQQIRALTGRAVLAWRFGTLDDVIIDAPSVQRLAAHAPPLIRSSFITRSSCVLIAAARYSEGLSLALEQLRFGYSAHLHFTIPYGLLVKASASAGVRQFSTAFTAIRDAVRLSPGDVYISTNASAIEARTLCMLHRWDEARARTSEEIPNSVTRSVRGDYRSAHALALACLGDATARSVADEIPTITRTKEAHGLRLAVIAICALQRDRRDEASRALNQLAQWDFADPIVIAYRSFPDLLPHLLALPGFRPRLERLLHAGRDYELARSVGISLPDAAEAPSNLTPREREVFSLLAEGATNREIARRLIISESTVKVHVHRILTKLGARSRTEALARVSHDTVDQAVARSKAAGSTVNSR